MTLRRMSERTVRFAVRLNEVEHERIEKLARSMNMTRTAAMRKLALDEADRRGITADDQV